MEEIIKIIQQIIAQKGRDVMTEKRFVAMFNDLIPVALIH